MRATIERAALHRAVRLAVAAAGRHRESPAPSLRLVADPGKRTLRVDAAGRALDLVQALPAVVDAGWCRAVATRPLAALVAALPDGPLSLEAVTAGRRAALAIGAGSFRAILPCGDPAESPAPAPPGPRCTPLLDAAELAAALASVAPAAARGDDPRAALAAVCCEIETDGLVLTATDGFRLARARVPFPRGERVALPVRTLIPARAVPLYRRLLSGARFAWLGIDEATASRGAAVHLVADAGRIVCPAVPAAPPRYGAAIPPSWVVRVTVDRALLRRAVRLAGRVAAEPTLVLLPGPSSLRLVARDPNSDASLVATLPAESEVTGEPIPVALGTSSLADPLRLCGGGTVELAWRATNEAMTIRAAPAEPAAGGRDCLWVVMPRCDPWAIGSGVTTAIAGHHPVRHAAIPA